MSDNWKTKNITLAYWLGEVCLFRKLFRLQSHNVDFINYRPTSDGDPRPSGKDEDACGYMIYSLPLKEGHKILWKEGRYINYISHSFRRFYIDLDRSFEDYLMQFSSKTRSTFRRKLKKFEKESGGEIDWRVYETPEEMMDFHNLARAVSKNTYQERMLDAGLPDDEHFLSEMKRYAENGDVRGFILFLNGNAVSYLYTPIHRGRAIYSHLGYLPEVSRLSAGTVLLLKVLEYFSERSVAQIFDFTEGQSRQKEHYSTNYVYCGNKIILQYNLKNAFWLWLHRAVNILSSTLARVLDAIGIKKFIKKFLRRSA